MSRIRLPAPEEIEEILSGVSKHSEKAESKLRKALGTALASMAEKEKEALVEALRPLSWQQIKALCYPEKWSRLDRGYAVAVIKTMRKLDASMLTIYPAINKPATRLPNNEEMNIIGELFENAASIMFDIGNGHHAKHVRMVFGSDQEVVERAKHTFTASAEALRRLLRKEGGVVIDELRKDAVWGCGGLTTQEQMALPVSAVKRDFENAFLTVVHEATHAAISPWDTTDHYYEYHDQFKKASPQEKLTTADYYKVVVRKITDNDKEVFMPGSGLVVSATDGRSAQLMNAAVEADKIVTAAWVSAIRIHEHLRDMANNPSLADKWSAWCTNASRLMGLTLHRPRWVIASYVGGLITVKTPSEEKSVPLTITALDLSIVDNKIAMLSMINGKGRYILTEPQPGLTHDKVVDHVIEQMLSTYLSRLSDYVFTKSADKDVIVIRSLANLHESIAGKELLDTLQVSLPDPMKSYDRAKGKAWM